MAVFVQLLKHAEMSFCIYNTVISRTLYPEHLMPQSVIIGAFVFGAVLLLIALTGGNFKLFSAEISVRVSSGGRAVAGIIGVVLLCIGVAGELFDLGGFLRSTQSELGGVPKRQLPSSESEGIGRGISQPPHSPQILNTVSQLTGIRLPGQPTAFDKDQAPDVYQRVVQEFEMIATKDRKTLGRIELLQWSDLDYAKAREIHDILVREVLQAGFYHRRLQNQGPAIISETFGMRNKERYFVGIWDVVAYGDKNTPNYGVFWRCADLW